MFKLKRANLPAAGALETTSVKDAIEDNFTVNYSNKKNGLNFFGADGKLFSFVRFSHRVKAALEAGEYNLAQLLKFGQISKWSDNEGNERYTFITPEEARAGVSTVTVSDLVSKAMPIARKKVTNISEMLSA